MAGKLAAFCNSSSLRLSSLIPNFWIVDNPHVAELTNLPYIAWQHSVIASLSSPKYWLAKVSSFVPFTQSVVRRAIISPDKFLFPFAISCIFLLISGIFIIIPIKSLSWLSLPNKEDPFKLSCRIPNSLILYAVRPNVSIENPVESDNFANPLFLFNTSPYSLTAERSIFCFLGSILEYPNVLRKNKSVFSSNSPKSLHWLNICVIYCKNCDHSGL